MDLAQVWCDKCAEPASVAIRLTSGILAFRCTLHAWALRNRGAR